MGTQARRIARALLAPFSRGCRPLGEALTVDDDDDFWPGRWTRTRAMRPAGWGLASQLRADLPEAAAAGAARHMAAPAAAGFRLEVLGSIVTGIGWGGRWLAACGWLSLCWRCVICKTHGRVLG